MSQRASAQINETASSRRKRHIEMPVRETSPYFSGFSDTPFLYRKASCACGGGCPSCATRSSRVNVSQPDDAAEIEADNIADRVMRMDAGQPLPTINNSSVPQRVQRKCSACDDEEVIQRKTERSEDIAGGFGLSSLIGNATRSGGQPLDRGARHFFEPKFGYDFGGVRIHTSGSANAAARAVNAHAYTLGSDIVFAAGMYTPGSPSGDRLLAHELAHVVQQDTGAVNRKTIHRAPAKEITGGQIPVTKSCNVAGDAPTGPEAKDSAQLTLSKSKKGTPCACLMFIHDNERNARKTAELMHENCAYNFVSVRHDTGKRCIKLPSHTVAGSFDPNEFFDPDIVKQCIDDEAACKDHLKNKLNSKNVAEIDRFVQISYFMSVKECSESFSLPVIALHNNAVNDTQAYRDQKAGKKVEELKKDDIEKGPLTGDEKKDEAADKLKLKPLSDMLLSKFGAEVKNKLTEGGKTNIIRWCFSGELSACHIGDPDRPDHVTWATNREDFDKLKAKNINVALQNDPARLKPESMTDLSTLFLSLKTLMGTKLGPEVAKVTADLATLAADHKFRISELAALTTSGGASSELGALRALVIQGMIAFLAHEMTHKQAELDAVQKEFDKYANLHFLNIEGPGYSLGERTDAGRVESYEIIVENLKALNLHCCDGKEAEAEAKVKAGLTLTPPPKAKSKP